MTDIEQIKAKLDIIDVISSYVPELKKAGMNFKANCPFHKEKTASFTVNPSLQIYKCFGCGKGGDVINFIQEIERIDFKEALAIAAEKAGIQIEEYTGSKEEYNERKRILEANLLTAKFYNYIINHKTLGIQGMEYAKKRKIDKERIEKFLVGFAPNTTNTLKKFLISRKFSDKELLKWGLLVERNGKTIDKFRERLMQPIFNPRGEIVGFSGRYIGSFKDAPKYLNSPETIVYKKNEMLYGLFQAIEFLRHKDFVILVEGNIDILSSHRVGIGNIVAPLGTAFTLNQAKLIKKRVETIYFSLDTDKAGTNALMRGMDIAEQAGLSHKVIDLEGYQDADELICKKPEEWQKRIDDAKPTVEYLISKISRDLNLTKVDDKSKFLTEIIPFVKLLRDDVHQGHYIKLISIHTDLDFEAVLNKVNEVISASKQKSVIENAPVVQKAVSRPKVNELEKYFLQLIMHASKANNDAYNSEVFQDEICKKIFSLLVKYGFDSDFGEISKDLSPTEEIIFEEIIMYESSDLDYVKEIEKTYKRIYQKYLNAEILKLRKSLIVDSTNDEAQIKLQHLLVEIGKMQHKK